jgi:hypothetical protein
MKELLAALKTMTAEERTGYILMERIKCPTRKSTLIIEGNAIEVVII